MELDWTTFILEIINFLVLVWLLKHFFYQPVMNVIGARQAAIDATVEQAREKERSAKSLAERYDDRLKVWEQEREQARETLRKELGAERERQLAQLRADLDAERTRQRAVDEKSRRERDSRAETAAIGRAAEFLSRLLQRIAGPELEGMLIDLAIEDLGALPDARRAALRETLRDAHAAIVTAYDLSAGRRQKLADALRPLLGNAPALDCSVDSTLIAGLRISVGPWTLRASLADELQAFANVDHLTA